MKLQLVLILLAIVCHANDKNSRFKANVDSYSAYLNMKTLACSIINKCLLKGNAGYVNSIITKYNNETVINYISGDITTKCYAKISDKLASSVVDLNDDLNCTVPEITELVAFNKSKYPLELIESNPVPSQYYKMQLAIEDLEEQIIQKNTNKKAKPALFGSELGKTSNANIIYLFIILGFIVIGFIYLINRTINSKGKKKDKKN